MALSVLAAKIRQVQNDPDAAAKAQAQAHSYTLRRRGDGDALDPSEQREQKRAKLGIHLTRSSSPRGVSDDAGQERYGSLAQLQSQPQPDVSYPSAMDPGGNPTEVMGPHTGQDFGNRNFESVHLSGDSIPADTPSSLALDFQTTEPSHIHAGSNFDLNMVDLLQGANFDSLFDIIGQQYPSF